MSDYHAFLASKRLVDPPTGINYRVELPDAMMPHQADIARWALRRGRAAVFAGTGLGKTLIELAWARQVAEHTGKPVLILAPLAVAHQHVREAEHFGLSASIAKTQADIGRGVFVTNYGKMDHFDLSSFGGIALDESSIIKSHDGKTRERLIRECQGVPFRLAATATPAPNDFMELGNHAEFLGVMSYSEMLAMFFVHDGGETQKWRLKGHAQSEFWRWMASWSVMLRKPSDLGYPNDGYDLPPLFTQQHTTAVEYRPNIDAGTLFPIEARTMRERLGARRSSIEERVDLAAEIVASHPDVPWAIWCHLNDESSALAKAIPGAVEIRGSDDEDDKERKLVGFAEGRIQKIVTKGSIAGWGSNWQHCCNTVLVGMNDSFEQVYQIVRRFWRFGQTKPVTAHFIASELEGAVVANLRRKEADAEHMAEEMVAHMADLSAEELHGASRMKAGYQPGPVAAPPWLPQASIKAVEEAQGPDWALYMGDAVETLEGLPDASVGYSVFSPPFSSLYTYSNSDRDMGNCTGDDEFFTHFGFLLAELYRVLMPGRSVSMHCMDLPTSKVRDGLIGLRDFPGELIRAGERAGFVYHSSVVIWKDPVTAMQRTKALGLLHKTIRNDSSMSRMGIPDRVVTLRKPGENPVPIPHGEDYPVDRWQKIASPSWDDINPSDTLQFRAARDENDERHIAPLQLEVIRRCVELWSAPKDIVLTPFAGIGSELYVALDMGRRAIGVELKPTYFQQAVSNLRHGDSIRGGSLFAKRAPACRLWERAP